jgi:hypothetical protein
LLSEKQMVVHLWEETNNNWTDKVDNELLKMNKK